MRRLGRIARALRRERKAPGVGRVTCFYARFWPLLRPHRLSLAGAAASMAGLIATGLLAPWPMQVVIDGVILGRTSGGALRWVGESLLGQPRALLLVACLAIVLIAGLRGLFSYGQRIIGASVGHRVVMQLRQLLFARLQRLSLEFHDGRSSGDLLVRLTGDVSMLRQILVPAALDASSRILLIAGMLALMLVMDWRLTLVAGALLPLLGMTAIKTSSRIRSAARRQRKKEGQVASVASEALARVKVVKAFSRETEVAERFSRQNRRSLRAGLKTLRLQEALARRVELMLAAGSALVMWVGADGVMRGALTPGELVVFLAYLKSLYRPVQGLARVVARMGKGVACGERVLEVLDSREEVQDRPDAVPAPPLAGEIVFENVTFGYGQDRPVLQDVSFRIAPGERVGVVGPSGAGKSTLLALLLRLYEPQRGRILVDGVDIRDYRIDSFRRQLAIVLQEPFLFGIPVEENIRCGRPEAEPGEVERAARAAEAHPFIAALPEGYATVLGERGASLSRGQQQRIALARALLRDAPILVFDEPTTGLDTRTEAGIVQTLSRASRGRTCLWIAHDLDQIAGCDRVIVLQDGRVAESGRPAELIARGGAFRRLFRGAC